MRGKRNRRKTGLGEKPELKLAPIGGTGRSIGLQDIAALRVGVKAEIPLDGGVGEEPGPAAVFTRAGLSKYLCLILRDA